jgi:hypothetical protein
MSGKILEGGTVKIRVGVCKFIACAPNTEFTLDFTLRMTYPTVERSR